MLPSKIIPMQPVLVREPFDDETFTFQVKWDGIRLISFIEHGRVRLQTRHLRDRTEIYPELHTLANVVNGGSVVLDGEVVAFGTEGLSFPAILRRNQVRSKDKALALADELPINYLVFDLLYVGGQSLLEFPLVQRQEMLQGIIQSNQLVQVVENFPSGIALFSAIKKQGLEGVVAKKKTSPYVPGGKTHLWRKIKVRRQQVCVVGGYLMTGTRLRSLLVGAWYRDKFVYLGRVGTGLSQKEMSLLEHTLPKLISSKCPFSPPIKMKGSNWVFPVLTVLVEYSDWTEQLHLRAPSIVGFPSTKPDDCQLEDR